MEPTWRISRSIEVIGDTWWTQVVHGHTSCQKVSSQCEKSAGKKTLKYRTSKWEWMQNYTKPNTSSYSLHTTTFPGRVLLHCVVNEVVIQKREIVIKRYWSAAGLRRCVFGRKPPVMSEVVEDFVIVGLRLPAGSRAVPEYHFLTGAVAQTEVRHVEVDLFEHTALSSPTATSPSDLPACLPTSSSFTTLLARPLLPLPSLSSATA